MVKNLPAMQEPQATQVRSLGQEDSLEEGMATHSRTLAWEISWTEELGNEMAAEKYYKESESVSHSVMSNSVTPWTAALQAPLSMEFSRQEY